MMGEGRVAEWLKAVDCKSTNFCIVRAFPLILMKCTFQLKPLKNVVRQFGPYLSYMS